MGITTSLVPEKLQPIYQSLKNIGIKNGDIKENDPDEELQKGFMSMINSQKGREQLIDRINSVYEPSFNKLEEMGQQVRFLKENGFDVKIDKDAPVNKMRKYIKKQFIEFKNKKFEEKQIKNKELSNELDNILKEIKNGTSETKNTI